MRIKRFSVERYRSIVKSEQMDLTGLTVLVGPNNEGKSNILRALVVGLEAISESGRADLYRRTRSGLRRNIADFRSYDWSRDFPLSQQQESPGASSKLEYEFVLSGEDVEAFTAATGHRLNGELKLRVLLSSKRSEIKIIKRGPANAALNDKIAQVARFVSERLRIDYVPVDRTFERSHQIVRREVSALLRHVRGSDEYTAAMRTIGNLERQALEPLEETMTAAFKRFVPGIDSIHISTNQSRNYLVSPEVDIEIDDGTRTSLAAKGDGVQSLVAISLSQALAEQDSTTSTVFALEEPESHLHPGAIRELAKVLLEISTTHQVVLTTHSPVLIRRDDVRSNLLVHDNVVLPARGVEEIRQSLGVTLPDNLSSCAVVVLTEGVHDAAMLNWFATLKSEYVRSAVDSGILRFVSIEGAANAPYNYRLYHGQLFRVQVVLDDDKEGRRAFSRLSDIGVSADRVSIISSRQHDCEMEDLLSTAFLSEIMDREFGVAWSDQGRVRKFSLHAKNLFRAGGRPWNDSVEASLKGALANALESGGLESLSSEGSALMSEIVKRVEADIP